MKDSTHDTRPRWHTLTYRLLYGPHALTDTQEVCAWTAPMALDQNTTDFYTAREHVYKATLDWNDLENITWKTWSPVLGGNIASDSSWYYGDIETVAEGPRDAAGHPMLWAGGIEFTTGYLTSLWRTAVDPTRNDTTPPRWIAVRTGLPTATISQIVPDRSDSMTAFCSIVTAGNIAHVFKTTSGGKKWLSISGNLPEAPVSAIVIDTLAEHGDPALKNQALIAGTDVGVFVTTNGGASWAQLGTGMPHIIVSDLKIYKNMLIAATHGRSLYAMDISGVQAVPSSVSKSLASSAPLLSVYPNPVTRGASFTIAATQDADATLCQLIATSSGRTFPATLEAIGSGSYRITADPGVPSGTYLVQLQRGGELLGAGSVTITR